MSGGPDRAGAPASGGGLPAGPPAVAVRLDRLTKRFRRSRPVSTHTTLKTALVEGAKRLGRGARAPVPADRFEVLSEISFEIARGETMGIIGRNGAGKTTLLKLIAGIYRPDAGRVQVSGRVAALLELGAGFHPDFTGRENITVSGIVLGLSKREVRARFDRIVDFAGIGDFLDAPVRTYSAGMYMRLAFSVAVHVDPDVLLVDEILAVGDEAFQRKSRAVMDERMRSGRRTTVLVSHDLDVIQDVCHRVVLLAPPHAQVFDRPADAVRRFHELMAAEAGP